jgi:hypothetical protein
MKLPEYLKQQYLKLDLSSRNFALMIDCDYKKWLDIENGYIMFPPDHKLVENISTVLNINLDTLYVEVFNYNFYFVPKKTNEFLVY